MSVQSDSMTAQESLDLIQRMVRQTKESFAKFSYYFLMWGVLLALAGISEYILDQQVHWEYSWIGWPIVGVIGGIAASIYNPNKSQRTNHFSDRMIGFLWGGFSVTLVAMLVCTVGNGINPGSFIILLTGLPTFVSGGIMRFRPLVIGGILFWVIGILSFFVLDEYRSLLFTLAIITGYIIPGLILRNEERNKSKTKTA